MRLRGSVSKEPKRTIFLREVLLPKMGHGVEGAGAAASHAADASGCGSQGMAGLPTAEPAL